MKKRPKRPHHVDRDPDADFDPAMAPPLRVDAELELTEPLVTPWPAVPKNRAAQCGMSTT